ncbi:NAD(P)/FAD-dependent oxidoreductase [Nonomuraea soli]|uniref:NADH dehydrogenase FAD-containing subunit n=1 Tax=Nonomuraea soli TaxID=1032476 RepID=A0A7W0CJ13_9ACTN|nr:FAD-dependent oxidoreductase [Nonomuraea soli]MBA2892008.1 NADH dehydrogenase FAD-containing subunit [Nonomuraea soli]
MAQRIVILGAGYTGMTAAMATARRLRRKDVQITLVNPETRFTERLRLHQTAAGQELKNLQIPEMVAGTGIAFVQGRVTGIDLDGRVAHLDGGRTVAYDILVYALGSVTDIATVPGVDENAYTLNTAAEARRLAERLAAVDSVVVGGGGLTGVESAAEIAETHPGLRVVLLSRDVPGSMMGEKARAYLHAGLKRLGVEVRTGVEIAKVLPDAVELADGERIETGATLWTTGTRVSPMAAQAGLTVDDRGRIVVDETLRSVSHPEVYAVGDAAAIRQPYGVIHGTCQSGIPTAAHAADAVARQVTGRQPKPFRFGYIHQPVSLGRRDGVIQFTRPDDTPRGLYLTGRWAVAYKEFVSSSPWKTYGLLKKYGGAVAWSHGGRATRTA